MRKRRSAALAVVLLSAGLLAPVAAQAATGGTLYVDNGQGSNCSDTGSGTSAVPYCTIQAAVNAVAAGDTVLVEPGSYAAFTDTASGTAASPITIAGAAGNDGEFAITIDAITLSGASYVDLEGLAVQGQTTGVLIEGSSHVTIDSSYLAGEPVGTASLEIAGTSSNVTVSRDTFTPAESTNGPAVQVDPGSTGDVITTNVFETEGSGIVVNGASGTDVTSNTMSYNCNLGIDLTGASTGSSVEDNVVDYLEDPALDSDCPASTAPAASIEVDAAAVSGTTVDYNVVYSPWNGINDYLWDGTAYASAAALNTATGQAAHDLNADPQAWPNPAAGSDVIDSANANAPGELSTDVYGNARVDDPLVADTGVGAYGYFDRGAIEYEDPLIPAVTPDFQTGTAPATVHFAESVGTAGWAPVTSWSIDFGDGSAPVTNASPATVAHTFAAAGTYNVTVTATDGYGANGRGTSDATTSEWILSDNVFHPVTLDRLLDTRNGTGTGGKVAPVAANSSVKLQIDGLDGIPASGVAAVALNVTAVNPTEPGNIIAYADGTTRPTTSNVDFTTGQIAANQVIAQVGGDGAIDLYNQSVAPGTVDLVADVVGYFGTGVGLGVQVMGSPTRLVDTRNGTGTGGVVAPVGPKQTIVITPANTQQFLGPDMTAVLNVTVTNAKSFGYLTVFPDGTTMPTTSNLNFLAGQTVANQVFVQTGSDGSIDFYNNGTGTVDVIADLTAMLTNGIGAGYQPISPVRMLDTRNGTGGTTGPVASFGTVNVPMDGLDGLPANLQSVAANVTVTAPTDPGDIEVYPNYLTTAPGVSTVNFAAGETVANSTTMSTESNGLKLTNQSYGTAQLIVDVFGYYQ